MLRPYQSRSVDFLLPRQRGFVIAPAGSGKTIIAAAAASKKAEPFFSVVWLANTREQCEQARDAIAKMQWTDPVTIAVHCVAARPDISRFDLAIIDECHHLPAATWWATVMFYKGIVWGFSATPWCGKPERDDEIKLFFGEENFITVPREEVLAGGSITKGFVTVHDLDHPGQFDGDINSLALAEAFKRAKKYPVISFDEHIRRCQWQFTILAIQANSVRNAAIIALAVKEPKSVLILVASIKHGELLKEGIEDAIVVHSKLPKKQRAAAIEGFRDGSLRVMIATSLADEGLDVPRAAVLILAAGGRSAGKLEQRAGRVMRPHASKEFGTVHDFADRGATLAHSQFKSRMRTYKALGYSLK